MIDSAEKDAIYEAWERAELAEIAADKATKLLRIAVLSDTRLPTSRAYPGHGLGKMAIAVAEGLAARGHTVELWAGNGSHSDIVSVSEFDDERDYISSFNMTKARDMFDVVLSNTHYHTLQKRVEMPIVNRSSDREAPPGKCALYPSKAHARFFNARNPRMVRNGIDLPEMPTVERGDYVAYLGAMHAHKGPMMAREAARLAGVKLVMAGPGTPPPGVEYRGELSGQAKWDFLAGARALVFMGTIESAGLVALEAQAVGTPVICTSFGGASEYTAAFGWNCADDTVALETALRVAMIFDAPRDLLREFVEKEFSTARMIDETEQALRDAANGEVW